MYFREQEKECRISLWTVISETSDCWDLLWIFSWRRRGFVFTDGVLWRLLRWSQAKRGFWFSRQPAAAWDRFFFLSFRRQQGHRLLIRLLFVRSDWNSQLNWGWIFTLCSHSSDCFIHPAFCLSVVEQHCSVLLRKEKKTLILLN